ncbi:hypothetical protein ACH4OY_13690 [Micromonospora rubida]|uniref:Uncharacterized protein n=1 Tax=Micromonospora rubida TaxID=2697657 RepID=A0ABW7SJ86_9ACTN
MSSPEYDPDVRCESDDHPQPCPDCDPRLFDDLRCRAMGVQAQAAYQEQVRPELEHARERFDAARAAYSLARDAAVPIVGEVREGLDHAIEALKCHIDDEHEIKLLKRAFRHVAHKLDRCGDLTGCYFTDDCDFEADVRGCHPDDIESKIVAVEKHVQAATTAFEDLITEPADLALRVAAVQAEVDAIVAAIGGDFRTTDFKRLYAAALVARRHLKAVWRGFANTNDYVDCLCRILTCMFRGHAAIGQLKGRAAVKNCHRAAAQARCDKLRQHTVDEVMAEYLRLRADPQRHPDPDEDPDDGGQAPRDPQTRQRDRQRERDRDRYGPSAYEPNQ